MNALINLRLWGTLFAAAALLVLGYEARTWVEPTPEVPASDTVIKERQITKRDTVTETVPRTVVQYDTVHEVDTITVAAPTELTLKGLIEPQPLDITTDEATLTYYDPSTKRYTQQVYDIPADRYRAGLYTVALRRWQRPAYQVGLGAEVYLNPQWLPGAIKPFGEVRVGQRLTATTGLQWHIVQL